MTGGRNDNASIAAAPHREEECSVVVGMRLLLMVVNSRQHVHEKACIQTQAHCSAAQIAEIAIMADHYHKAPRDNNNNNNNNNHNHGDNNNNNNQAPPPEVGIRWFYTAATA